LKFFEVHQTADKFQSQSCIELLMALSPAEQEIALQAVDEALDGLWDFLTEVHAH
jgi:pyrroloquinoline quinone (PQQ) biosynthesis protein C